MQDPALSRSANGQISALRSPSESSGSKTFTPDTSPAPAAVSDSTLQMLLTGNKKAHERKAPKKISLEEYLLKAKSNPDVYDNAHARMLRAIGAPVKIDPHNNPRAARLFGNGLAAKYDVFKEFHGIEDSLGNIVEYMRSGGQRQETSKKILVLVGNVASGKSSIVDLLKELFQQQPFYALTDPADKISPMNESPLALFDPREQLETAPGEKMTNAQILEESYKIPPSALPGIASSWVATRLDKAAGDLTNFTVTELYPSVARQRGIAKVSPVEGHLSDEVLSGKTDETKLQRSDLERNDPDAYMYGAYGVANNGLLELAEICQADYRDLSSLLDATAMGTYKGTEPALGPLPFSGIVIAHTTLDEWKEFSVNKKNKGLLSRMHVVKIPYALEVTAEEEIYKKELNKSDLAKAPCAKQTLRLAAEFAVLTRLLPVLNKDVTPENPKLPEDLIRKLEIYDGADPKALHKDNDPPEYDSFGLAQYRARALIDHKDEREGMDGVSPRWMNTALANTFNYSAAGGGPVEADPVHLFEVLEKGLKDAGFEKDKETKYIAFITNQLKPRYKQFITKEIEAYAADTDTRATTFARYYELLDALSQDLAIRSDSGDVMQAKEIENELQAFEKPLGVSGEKTKDLRTKVVNAVLHFMANGRELNEFNWESNSQISGLIQNKTDKGIEELRPVIEFSKKATEKETKNHEAFVKRMVEGGYTTNQVRTLVTWALRK